MQILQSLVHALCWHLGLLQGLIMQHAMVWKAELGLSMLTLLHLQRHVAEECGIGPRQCVARLAPGHLSRCIPLSIPSILWAARQSTRMPSITLVTCSANFATAQSRARWTRAEIRQDDGKGLSAQSYQCSRQRSLMRTYTWHGLAEASMSCISTSLAQRTQLPARCFAQ